MKISRVEATYLRAVPIQPPPFRAAPSRRDAVVVEVETDDGLIGYSLLGDTRVSQASLPVINDVIARVVVGLDSMLVEQIWNRLTTEFEGKGFGTAIAAVDVALWDIRGKALNQPIWRLLGGSRQQVETYITFGATGPNTGHSDAPAYEFDELVREASFHAQGGQGGLKMGVARADAIDVESDFARAAAVREAVGPSMKLMMDARRRLSIDEATRLCRLVEPLHITFFEDPVLNNDPRLLAELGRRTIVPLTANALVPDRWGYRDLLVGEATQLVSLNAVKLGITEAVAVAHLAEAFNKRIANGNGNGPHNAQLHGGVRNGSWVEYHYNVWMLYEALFEAVPRPDVGWVTLPETPGFGLDPRADVIREHRVPAM